MGIVGQIAQKIVPFRWETETELMEDKSNSIGNGGVTILLILGGIVIIFVSNDGGIEAVKIIGYISIAAGCILLILRYLFYRLELSNDAQRAKQRSEALNLIIEEYLRNKDKEFLKYIVSKSESKDIDDIVYGYLTSDYDAPKNEIEEFYRDRYSKRVIAVKVIEIANKILKEDDLDY